MKTQGNNSHDLFNQYYSELNTAISKLLYFKRIPEAEKSDLRQEILLKAFNNIHKYDPTKMKATTFITTIGKSKIIDLNRTKTASKRGGTDTVTTSLDFCLDEEGNSLHDLIGKMDNIFDDASILKQVVYNTVSKLKETHQKIFQLYFVEELEYSEIVEQTGSPMGTVKGSIFQIRQKLMENLAPFKSQLA